ncbi:MAG: ABC transporter ATP-binding protein [Candidatus Nanopelagicales bacterium]|nr:ABC transporter ATP-binding protein [Candidatus Nanopelagicales bacterium]MDZ4250629.1 ABC transporter ATP-binding protein [Candidatus Nanopelagicales bacterium]
MSMPGPRAAAISYSRDRRVLERKLARGTVRRVIRYAGPFRQLVILFLGTLLVGAVLTVVQPLLFRRIVDDGISVGDSGVVTVTAALVALAAVADASFGLWGRYLSARIGEGLIFALRCEVFGHVQRQSLAFFTRTQTGALVSRLNTDVIGAQQAFTSTLSGVVGNLITVVVMLATMFWLSWQITLLAMVLVPLFLLPARWMGRRLQSLTREQMEMNAELSTQMTERFNVAGALLVKLFGRPEQEDSEFAVRAGAVRDTGVRIATVSRYFITALALIAALATASAYGVGGNLVIGGALTLGTLLAIVAILGQMYGPLTALSNVRVDVMTALVSFERVFELLDLPPLVADAPDALELASGLPTCVELRHVSFAYPPASRVSLASLEPVSRPDSRGAGGEVLKDVSFRVEPGRMVALVGPSGAGKTTISSLVARLYDADDGSVLVGDTDVRTVTQESLHRVVGVVTQEAHMFHDTIRANLLYARPDASEEELWRVCGQARIAELIEALPEGLDTVVGDRGYRLSGGEKQRVAIARLLLKCPDVVVLDEATAHLDSESESAVHAALTTALAGRTALVIAHRLSTVRRADEILVVVAGRVVERGTHEELLASGGTYADLYLTQFAAQERDAQC